jgi:hypothetical protein
MVGCITYLATKTEPNKGITEALRLFFVGLICIFLRAVVDYYSSLNLFGDFRKNVDSYYRNALDWERLIETKAKTKVTAFVAHTLGWLSALCCLAGIVLGMRSLP